MTRIVYISSMQVYVPLPTLLETYTAFDEEERQNVRQLQYFLRDSQNPYDRSNLVAHTIVDAWVVSPDREMVLLHVHAERNIWTTPGGHTDGNPDMLASALRELEEEAGLSSSQLRLLGQNQIFDINVGNLPPAQKPHGFEPKHFHFDICFAFEADPASVVLRISEESKELRWCNISEALQKVLPEHQRRAHKTLQRWGV